MFHKPRRREGDARHVEQTKESRRRRDRALDKDEDISRFFATPGIEHLGRDHNTSKAQVLRTPRPVNARCRSSSPDSTATSPPALQYAGFDEPSLPFGTTAPGSSPETSVTRSVSWAPTSQESASRQHTDSNEVSGRGGHKAKVEALPNGPQISAASDDSSSDASDDSSSTDQRRGGQARLKLKRPSQSHSEGPFMRSSDQKQARLSTDPPCGNRRKRLQQMEMRATNSQSEKATFREDLKKFFDKWRDKIQGSEGPEPAARSGEELGHNGACLAVEDDSHPQTTGDQAGPVNSETSADSPMRETETRAQGNERENVSHDRSRSPRNRPLQVGLDDNGGSLQHVHSPPLTTALSRSRGQPPNAGASSSIPFASLHFADRHPLHGLKPLYESQMLPADDQLLHLRRHGRVSRQQVTDVDTGAKAPLTDHWRSAITGHGRSDTRTVETLNKVATVSSIIRKHPREWSYEDEHAADDMQPVPTGLVESCRSPAYSESAGSHGADIHGRLPPLGHTTSELDFLHDSLTASDVAEPEQTRNASRDNARDDLEDLVDAVAATQQRGAEEAPVGFWRPNILY